MFIPQTCFYPQIVWGVIDTQRWRAQRRKNVHQNTKIFMARATAKHNYFLARALSVDEKRNISKKGILLPLACFVFFSQLHLRSLPKFIRDVVDLKMIFNLDALRGKIISQNTFSCILIIWQKKGYKNFLKNIFLDKIYISVFFKSKKLLHMN